MPEETSAETVLFPYSISLSDLDVLSVAGTEGISQLMRFDLHLVSEYPDVNFDDVVNSPATLTIECGEGEMRHFHGVISRFAQGDASPHHVEYYAELVPKCWLLTLRHQSRIFQQKDVETIVQEVLDDAGFSVGTDFKFDLTGNYSKREYCVQYRETDFNFICRLLEEEGIFYFFQHDENGTVLVMADHSGAHPDCAPDNEALCHERAGELDTGRQYVFQTRYEQQVCSGKVALKDFNFEKPTMPMLAESKIGNWDGTMEVYDYPGRFKFRDVGEQLAKVRLEELDARRRVLTGRSNFFSFASGHKVRMKAEEDARSHTLLNSRDDLNDKMYLVTRVTHRGEQRAILAHDSPGTAGAMYENEFEAIPFDTPFRPRRTTPKPIVQGSQTAIVVGPSGEEIFTEDYGRVKVQFHWDRQGEYNDKSSCWIRVASGFAGGSYGDIFIPRIGQEVIVDFLEGDPDQPIITGRVYNADNMPPLKLPDEKTRSTTKTNSSKGGGGFNQIRLEDKKGEEQIFVHGEKDADVRIKNDCREWIGNDRSLFVKRDKLQKVDRDNHVKIKRDEMHEIGRDHSLTVKGKEAVKVTKSRSTTVQDDVIDVFKANHSEQTTKDYYLKAKNIVIEGMTNVTVKVGQSFIAIEAGGIKIGTTGQVIVDAKNTVDVKGAAGVTVESPAQATLKSAKTTVKGDAMVSVDGGGMTEVKGGLVKIN